MDTNKEEIESSLSYHYCSVDTMFSIIQNKKLWLSSAKYMNDKYEVIWIDNIVEEVIKELHQEKPHDNAKLAEFKKIYDEIAFKEHFLMCFSENGDLLSQWRGYGDDAKGVSLGFNIFNAMSNIGLTSKSNGVNGEIPSTFRLGYESIDYNVKSMINNFIKRAINDKEQYKSNAIFIKELSSMAKHDYFSEENEVRITYTPENLYQDEINQHLDKILKRISNKKFRSQNSRLIPYYELNFNSEYNSLILPQIILGSKSNIDEKDLEEFLIQNGFNETKIEKSEAPYI